LHNIGCSLDACKALNELAQGMNLRGLYLYNNMSGDEGAKELGNILSRMLNMERFQMASSRVGCSGALHLADGLCHSKRLLDLDLNDNPLTAGSVTGIGKLIELQSRLQAINLSDTSLGDDGVSQLADALIKGAPELQVALH